jgi:peptidylprolyl isomerase
MAPKQYSQYPAMVIDKGKKYNATIKTPRGDVTLQLLPDTAPLSVNSFVFLAREGFYDGLTWHRVLENFMAQGGCPLGTGTGGPGYNVRGEFSKTLAFDRKGILAMARAQSPDSAGSQFFITTAPCPWLNGQYTIFGHVTKGQEIIDKIPLRDPQLRPREPGEQIISITISEG